MIPQTLRAVAILAFLRFAQQPMVEDLTNVTNVAADLHLARELAGGGQAVYRCPRDPQQGGDFVNGVEGRGGVGGRWRREDRWRCRGGRGKRRGDGGRRRVGSPGGRRDTGGGRHRGRGGNRGSPRRPERDRGSGAGLSRLLLVLLFQTAGLFTLLAFEATVWALAHWGGCLSEGKGVNRLAIVRGEQASVDNKRWSTGAPRNGGAVGRPPRRPAAAEPATALRGQGRAQQRA
jgi:hypothetical protein